MPGLHADPTTDHRRDATVSRHGSVSADGFPPDATTDHDEDSPGLGTAPDLRHERFRIGDKLGEGGMGVVFRAVDARDGREVALKLMKATLAGTARRRFEREFRSISSLHHPHCLHVFDFGELDGGPFFTMELFQGWPITSLAGRPIEACSRRSSRSRWRSTTSTTRALSTATSSRRISSSDRRPGPTAGLASRPS